MNVDLSRRSFLKLTGAGAAATTLGAMGFGAAEAATAAHVRAFKLATTTETRNICTYCSVACGIIMYSRGDLAAGETADLLHIEGDADHPTNRGTLCPKGAALKSYVKAATRLTRPRIRRPGSDRFEDISWDDALDRIAVMHDGHLTEARPYEDWTREEIGLAMAGLHEPQKSAQSTGSGAPA